MTDNHFHQDAPISDQQPVSVQLGLTVLELREIAKIPELLTRAKQSIESGVSAFRAAAEYLADAQELGVSQRQLADEVGKSAAWVNALLKWRERGYPDGTPFRPQAKARPRLVKAVQETEQNGWEATDRPAITHEQVEITASGLTFGHRHGRSRHPGRGRGRQAGRCRRPGCNYYKPTKSQTF